MVVVRIQNLDNGFRQVFLLHCLLVVSLVEGIQTEGIDCLRIPDSQRIHHIVAVADDRHVVGDGADGLISLLNEMLSAVLPDSSHVTAEFYLRRILCAAYLERIAVL